MKKDFIIPVTTEIMAKEQNPDFEEKIRELVKDYGGTRKHY